MWAEGGVGKGYTVYSVWSIACTLHTGMGYISVMGYMLPPREGKHDVNSICGWVYLVPSIQGGDYIFMDGKMWYPLPSGGLNILG